MTYTVENGVRCRRCGFVAESMDAAVDHAEATHGLITATVHRALVDGGCRYCDTVFIGRDAAVDHLEAEHNLITNAVLDSVRRVEPVEVADD